MKYSKEEYLERAQGVVETDTLFREENLDMTVSDYALELVEDDIETAILTRQTEWARELRIVRKKIKRS